MLIKDAVVLTLSLELLKRLGIFNVTNWLGLRADMLSVQATMLATAGSTSTGRLRRHLRFMSRVSSSYDG